MILETVSDYIDRISQVLSDNLPLNESIQEVEGNLLPEQISVLLESFPIAPRLLIWNEFQSETKQDIFIEMKYESRQMLLSALEDEECYPLFDKLDAIDLLDLADDLDDRFMDYALSKMTLKQKAFFKTANDYGEEELGRWQSFDEAKVPQRLKVASVKKLCAKNKSDLIDSIYITDDDSKFLGELKFKTLFAMDDTQTLKALEFEEVNVLHANKNIDDAIEEVILSGKCALPVIDENGCLTGRLDLNTAYKYKEQEQDLQTFQSGGMTEEEDLFASVWLSSKNRAIWLGINLLTAFLASWFIGLFEATLQQVVTLAVLMPVVASMGGISGSQTLTLVIRGLALGQINESNRRAIVQKELKVGLINGLLWASVIGGITYFWFFNPMLSLTISIAILGNVIVASFSGVWVPWILEKMNIDPALSGSVVLTTVTDIFGFVAFLGCGSWLLL